MCPERLPLNGAPSPAFSPVRWSPCRAGDGLGGYLGRWLLLGAAGGDVEVSGKLATSRQIPLTRTIVGGKLNMEDI